MDKQIYIVKNGNTLERELLNTLKTDSFVVSIFDDNKKLFNSLKQSDENVDVILILGESDTISCVDLSRVIRSLTKKSIFLYIEKRLPELQTIISLEYVDDIVIKQHQSINELVARIHRTNRRIGSVDSKYQDGVFYDGPIFVGLDDFFLKINGEPIQVSKKPLMVLRKLVINSPNFVPHESIMDAVWGSGDIDQDNLLRANIKTLRKIFSDYGFGNKIVNKSSVGYAYMKFEDVNKK